MVARAVQIGLVTRQNALSLPSDTRKAQGSVNSLPIATLNKMECKSCPMNKAKGLHSPKMKPTGSDKPLVYVLGEAPGEWEDKDGEQFVGRSGKYLRTALKKVIHKTRFNNCIRCRPPKNRNPDQVEVECCRRSIEKDIAKHKPAVIIAVGTFAHNWLMKKEAKGSISDWRGRRYPVKIEGHTCWVYPVLHPAALLRGARDEVKQAWQRDMARAIRCAKSQEKARVWPEDFSGIRCVTGNGAADFDFLIRHLRHMAARGERVTTDIETNAYKPYVKDPKLLAVAIGNYGDVVSFAVNHREAGWSRKERIEIMVALAEVFTCCEVVAHNAIFELEWFSWIYSEETIHRTRHNWHCTQVQAYKLDERASVQSLDALCRMRFGVRVKQMSGVDRKNLEAVELTKLLRYCGGDVKWTDLLDKFQMEDLEREGLLDTYNLHRRRLPTLAFAQIKGLDVDGKAAKEMRADYQGRIDKIKREIAEDDLADRYRNLTGQSFNALNNHHVLKLFKDILKRKEVVTYRGKTTTDSSALGKIKLPMAGLVVKLRKLDKQKSTYLDNLMPKSKKTVLHDDGRIHTSFNTTFTDTCRLSSDGPNVQNYPKRDPEAKKVRRIIIPPRRHVFMCSDYGQLEARIIACDSKDPNLVRHLWAGYDIHMAWAERVCSLSNKLYAKCKKDIKVVRGEIKNILVFPLFFGSEYEPVIKACMLPSRQGTKMCDEFWDEFSGVKTWQEELLENYDKLGYVESLTGHRRRAPLSVNQIINSPIQGCASDLVVDAMNRLSERAFDEDRPALQGTLNIHDDLTFSVPVDQQEEVAEDVVVEMCDAPFDWINVPIQVELTVGPNWYEQRDIGKYNSHEL